MSSSLELVTDRAPAQTVGLLPDFLLHDIILRRCQCMTSARKYVCPLSFDLGRLGETWLSSIDKELVFFLCVFFFLVISEWGGLPLTAPAFPVFLCLCWMFSTNLSAQLLDFILPTSCPPHLLLSLPGLRVRVTSAESVSVGLTQVRTFPPNLVFYISV